MQGPNRSKYTSVLEMHVKKPIVFNAITIRKKTLTESIKVFYLIIDFYTGSL
jgi:hypothetical protein